MKLHVIQDEHGKNTGFFIPIHDWNVIIQKHEDLKALVNIEPTTKKKLSDLVGTLSHEIAEAMQNYVKENRNEWDDRLKNQF
jgi:hypothetical protein